MRIERANMKFYQEITDWAEKCANHVYLLSEDKSKMFAYVKSGSKSVFTFKTPIRIDVKGRKFKQVPNVWHFKIPKEPASNNPKWQVKGSKGDVYVVEKTETGLTCTCPGYKFRSKCKHTELYK